VAGPGRRGDALRGYPMPMIHVGMDVHIFGDDVLPMELGRGRCAVYPVCDGNASAIALHS
jgi:hypothetical protein